MGRREPHHASVPWSVFLAAASRPVRGRFVVPATGDPFAEGAPMPARCPPPPPRRHALTVPEFATIFGIPDRTAYELARRGDLACVRLGRRVVIPLAEAERLLGHPVASDATVESAP